MVEAGVPTAQVFVRADRTHVLDLPTDATAASLLHAVAARLGAPVDALPGARLVVDGRDAQPVLVHCACEARGGAGEALPLARLGVGDGSEVALRWRGMGGAKKRKKKTYTKPKKLKHKRKKVNLKTLQFYRVDEEGRIVRTRKTCPKCGPGVFMATHRDRFYCGQCGTTYVAAQLAGPGAGSAVPATAES